MNNQERKKMALLLQQDSAEMIERSKEMVDSAGRLAALSDAINPDTPDTGDDSVLSQITSFIDDIEDSPLGLIPQVKAAAMAVDAAEDMVSMVRRLF